MYEDFNIKKYLTDLLVGQRIRTILIETLIKIIIIELCNINNIPKINKNIYEKVKSKLEKQKRLKLRIKNN